MMVKSHNNHGNGHAGNNNRKKTHNNQHQNQSQSHNHNHNQNQNQNQNRNRRNHHPNTSSNNQHPINVKKQPPSISNISEYQQSVVYGALDYKLPEPLLRQASLGTQQSSLQINELPKFVERPAALLVNTRLRATYLESLKDAENPMRSSMNMSDPAVQIVLSNRSKAKTLKLGDTELSAYTSNKKPPAKKLVNKLLTKESLVSTPLKRNRDEFIEVSSSIKKNKRTLELQQQETSMMDTTMELSFEGKAMDRSDLVKLVDSSMIVPDESHLQDANDQHNTQQNSFFDTKNLLQYTDFNFEFRS